VTSRWWLRTYIAIYVLLIVCIVMLVVPSCPKIIRTGTGSRFDVALSVGCSTEGFDGASLGVWGHAGGWLLHAGVATLVGLVLSVALKRQPTLLSIAVWFSAGIAEWWYPLSPRGWSEYRSWIAPVEFMFWLTMSLIVVAFIVAIPAGVSLSVARVQDKASRSTRVALGATGLVLLMVTGAIYSGTLSTPLFPAPQPILHAWQEDPTSVVLGYGCPSQPSVEVVQAPEQVVVSFRGLTTTNMCAGFYVATLDEPLGDRPLIDGATGKALEVENRLTPERS
jgi:hypothetical protein